MRARPARSRPRRGRGGTGRPPASASPAPRPAPPPAGRRSRRGSRSSRPAAAAARPRARRARRPRGRRRGAARSSGGSSTTSATFAERASGPERREREAGRLEGNEADLVVSLRRPGEHPGAVVQREGLEKLRLRIEEPEEADAARAVKRPLLGQVEAAGARARGSRRPSPGRARSPACPESVPMRSRRQPARSGTTTSPPRCSSGSMAKNQPPGPADAVRRTGSSSCTADLEASPAHGARPGAGGGAARRSPARRPCSRARRGRPGRSPAGEVEVACWFSSRPPDVDRREEEEPDHVDEVPVPGRRLEADVLGRA